MSDGTAGERDDGTPERPVGRKVIRSRRLQLAGAALSLIAIGMLVVAYVGIASPGRSDADPEGFTPGLRVFLVVLGVLSAGAIGWLAVRALRVKLIIDGSGIVIRNQGETTVVRWDSKPKFESRTWTQTSSVSNPETSGTSEWTVRFRGVVCVVKKERITIAATARLTRHHRVDRLLEELRDTGGRARGAGGNGRQVSRAARPTRR